MRVDFSSHFPPSGKSYWKWTWIGQSRIPPRSIFALGHSSNILSHCIELSSGMTRSRFGQEEKAELEIQRTERGRVTVLRLGQSRNASHAMQWVRSCKVIDSSLGDSTPTKTT